MVGGWYKVLDKLVTGGTGGAALKKMLVDQVSHAQWIAVIVFCASKNYMVYFFFIITTYLCIIKVTFKFIILLYIYTIPKRIQYICIVVLS